MLDPRFLPPTPPEKTRIAVAMSGGVDSNMVAYLLAKAGYNVMGFTAWTLNGPGKCCNDALVNAGRMCDTLGIQYDTVDLRAEFAHFVMDYYHDSYAAGLTPNPCVECNQHVKWERLVDYAREHWGVDYVATGHYAQIEHNASLPEGFRLTRAVDERKDQTYMMCRVRREDLRHALFPLGHLTKPEVVAMAREAGIPEAHSKESQDICFVLDGHAQYMKRQFGAQPGPIVHAESGAILGEHEGCFGFTVGQRKGIKIAANAPLYVVKVDPTTNTVYVGPEHLLQCATFTVRSPYWVQPRLGKQLQAGETLTLMTKIRYNTPPKLAQITALDEETLSVTLETPLSAVTPGQISAFYDADFCELFGGGYIDAFLPRPDFTEANRAAFEARSPVEVCSV